MRDTLKSRILALVKTSPGKSATEIANMLGAKKDSVASILYTFVQTGLLIRKSGKDGAGPRGGYIYFEAPSKVTRKTRFERVLQD